MIGWQRFTERMVGQGHPKLADTNNRALRQVISDSGGNPDADPFTGFLVLTKIYNAAAFAGATPEAKITAAVAAAKLIGYAVYIPASMLPYNAALVVFDGAVRMYREGGNPSVFEVEAYGAAGNAAGAVDDAAAINAAITGANTLHAGSGAGQIVQFDSKQYGYAAPLVTPAGAGNTSGAVILRGKGMRSSYLYPLGPAANFAAGSYRVGPLVPDASGTFTNQTLYCGIEDLAFNGSLLTGGGTAIAVALVELQKGWMKNVIIEGFGSGASIGLYLRGSTTVGLGSAAAPHLWRCRFENVLVVTTVAPLVWENADENDFIGCNFGIVPGVASPPGAANAFNAVYGIQGRNNRFFSTLLSGDTNVANRPSYVGIKMVGTIKGNTAGNQFYGLVAEGFNKPFWVVDTSVAATILQGYNSSINAELFDNAGYPGGFTEPNNQTVIIAPQHNIFYCAGVLPAGDSKTLNLGAGNNTPDLTLLGNLFQVIGNGGGSNIVSFTTDPPTLSRLIYIRLDANTTLVDASQTGGVNIRLWGRQNLAGSTEMWVALYWNGGTWYQVGLPMGATATAAFVFPVGIKLPIAFKTANYNVAASDHTVRADATAGAITMTLPDAIAFRGQVFVIKKIDSTVNVVTVATTSAQLIDGVTTHLLTAQYQSITVQSNGANWEIL